MSGVAQTRQGLHTLPALDPVQVSRRCGFVVYGVARSRWGAHAFLAGDTLLLGEQRLGVGAWWGTPPPPASESARAGRWGAWKYHKPERFQRGSLVLRLPLGCDPHAPLNSEMAH